MDWATLLQAIVFSRFFPAPQSLFLRPTSRAILAASQPIILTASLVPGVAAADAAKSDTLLAGVAGLVAGAMSMAAGI
jgi:VIT1/CCC1 family predicted Fe2+/Mn2+ transporter